MNLPGSYQVGLSAKLLRQYPWWQFTPHPEWVTPRGTTLLEPHRGQEFDVGNFAIASDENLNRKLYDARGVYRGELSPGLGQLGTE